jgi:hypothetical protein
MKSGNFVAGSWEEHTVEGSMVLEVEGIVGGANTKFLPTCHGLHYIQRTG